MVRTKADEKALYKPGNIILQIQTGINLGGQIKDLKIMDKRF
ncbi:hypothetical protein SAMN05660649_00532 [Desulfotomaculum arcticum]|uniref:Uncharacterized protein n=1 Tax=Desulfotruncus arcticus DSM 17038 TaxID=1121424 RepID=A0A1I2NS15_9FIRM|nr:hypothetical protein SAMN05660649_00532 [Desulfotomaculum arcticum] [Desulfotruncus arcticus DSM 17038]